MEQKWKIGRIAENCYMVSAIKSGRNFAIIKYWEVGRVWGVVWIPDLTKVVGRLNTTQLCHMLDNCIWVNEN